MAKWLKALVLKPKACVQSSGWSSILSNQDYIESNILIFFSITTKSFIIFFVSLRYDQRVSGFILCEDVPKISFLRPQASALISFAITRNLKDKNILAHFGGNHLRSCAVVAEWFKAPVLKSKTWVQYSGWSSLSSNQDYIESSILIFFQLRQNRFEYFLLDTKFDQKVSGFILCEDAPKSTFLTPKASALLFLGVR